MSKSNNGVATARPVIEMSSDDNAMVWVRSPEGGAEWMSRETYEMYYVSPPTPATAQEIREFILEIDALFSEINSAEE